MKKPTPTTLRVAVKEARHHLAALVSDTRKVHGLDQTRVTRLEIAAINAILEEIHRLHTVVAAQSKALETAIADKKQPPAKPQDARSQAPITSKTTEKPERHRQEKK